MTLCDLGVCKYCSCLPSLCGISSFLPARRCSGLNWPFHCCPAWFDVNALTKAVLLPSLLWLDSCSCLLPCVCSGRAVLFCWWCSAENLQLHVPLGFEISVTALVFSPCTVDPACLLPANAAACVRSGRSTALSSDPPRALLWSLCLHFRCFQ